jgi:hypothetical protein
MNVIPLQGKICERTLKYLDAYVGNELMVETNQEILNHLEICQQCSEALRDRLRLKTRVREAVQSEEVPAGLREKVRATVRKEVPVRGEHVAWSRWALAAAAVFVVCLSGWAGFRLYKINIDSGAASQLAQKLSLSEQVAGILRIGAGDHIHCVIDSHFDQIVMTSEKMAEKMGPEYFGLVTLLNDEFRGGFVVSAGHRCQVKGREFIHMVIKHEGQPISVIITEKQNVSFPASSRVNSMNAQGVALHQDRIEGLEAVGFETNRHLAFIVSALDHQENFQIASQLAPAVSGLLNRL